MDEGEERRPRIRQLRIAGKQAPARGEAGDLVSSISKQLQGTSKALAWRASRPLLARASVACEAASGRREAPS
jgi:hypothetical protein